jgi:hypothetical protein
VWVLRDRRRSSVLSCVGRWELEGVGWMDLIAWGEGFVVDL